MFDTEPLISSQATEPVAILQRRFQASGYLYLPGAIENYRCRELLHQVINCMQPHVDFDAQQRLPVLRREPFFETDPVWDEVYPRIQSLYDFHRFFHERDVRRLMQLVAGNRVFVYPMKMGRVATPGKVGFETPPHQDAHSHCAGPTMVGIWVALHDVVEGMGRLQLMPGSHRQGVRNVYRAQGVGGVQCEIFPGERTWHVSDVAQGDVILFHSRCVHRAEPNTSEKTVRISIDTRFCDYGAPVFSLNLQPHHGHRIAGFDWESIYRDWPQESLQYYWRDYPALFGVPG